MNTDVYEQLAKWIASQPHWLQDATWRIYNKLSIDQSQINKYVDMCIAENLKKEFSFNKLDVSMLPNYEKRADLVVDSINSVQNVNALANNTELYFGTNGVSVVYGLNGAGKSGFMRIFKHVSNHPYAEPIQQNVYATNKKGTCSCIFNLKINDNNTSIECNLSEQMNNNYLSQLDVFDTKISGAYISKANSASYEPFVFSVLRELADIADEIGKAVQHAVDLIEIPPLDKPAFLNDYEPSEWLDKLSYSSSVPCECESWNSEDRRRLDALKLKLDTQKTIDRVERLNLQKSQISKVIDDIKPISEKLKAENRTRLINAYEVLSEKKKQLALSKALFENNASKIDKESIDIQDWKQLWYYAKQYYEIALENHVNKKFAETDSICPLCHQPINARVAERFSSIDEYVNGKCNEEYKEAQSTYLTEFKSIIEHTLSPEISEGILQGIVDQPLIESVKEFYNMMGRFANANFDDNCFEELIGIDEISALSIINAVYSSIETELNELESALKKDSRLQLEEECINLEYREWVFEHLETINSIISQERKKEELLSVRKLINTNRITMQANTLAQILISDTYISRFNKELSNLAPGLKVKLEKGKSKKGKSPYKVVIDSKEQFKGSPEDILSEGEQRIVSLAAFFADATGRLESTPIIIDDPISSLDFNYEDSATKRIVELAKHRQVIVFTHRISLLVGLSEECDRKNVPFKEQYIRSASTGKGVPDFEEVYHGKIDSQLGGIKQRLIQAKDLDPTSYEYEASVSRISQQLRICVERSLEDVLLQKTVTRFSRRIMTGKVTKLARITEEDCAMIDSMMTKYSFYEHSQPVDCYGINLNLDEVCQDIDDFIAWIKQYNKRMN